MIYGIYAFLAVVNIAIGLVVILLLVRRRSKESEDFAQIAFDLSQLTKQRRGSEQTHSDLERRIRKIEYVVNRH